MKKKTASAIMLTLLLTSILTLAFNIQPVKSEPKGMDITMDDASILVSVLIDYRNGSRSWYGRVLLPYGATAFNATLAVATVNYSFYVDLGVLVEAINGVCNSHPCYWNWLYWNSTESVWIYGPVACDKYLLTKGDIIAWLYENIEFPTGPTTPPPPRTIIVPDDYPTIQEAINAANPGDTISVGSGTYYEHVIVNKTVSLIGENRNSVIIDGNSTGTVVHVSADNVIITEFTIQNGGTEEGNGIELGSDFNFINSSIITGNAIGIYVYNSHKNVVQNTELTDNVCGIVFDWANHNIFKENEVINNVYGIALTDRSDYIIVEENHVSLNYHGIYLENSWDNNLTRNVIANNTNTGIYALKSYENRIGENIVINNLYGLYLHNASGNILYGNYITNEITGITIDRSDRNTLTENNILNNQEGIWLSGSSGNILFSNTASYNDYGIWLLNSDNNILSGNTASNNRKGIELFDDSDSNTLTSNNFLSNQNGIGLLFTDSNRIFHNNFINNTRQAYSYASTSVWDDGYPFGGNYWSDYTGIDADGDGIGDAPYVIDADNQDRYPLVHPWSSLPVHNINTGLGYATIQEAINANETLDGHTIFVEAGTYYENVVINKTVSLIGEQSDITIIGARTFGVVVSIIADFVVVSNFTIQNSGGLPEDAGIRLDNSEGSIILNNNIRNSIRGISQVNSCNCTIRGNTVSDTVYGIVLISSVNNIVVNNIVVSSMSQIHSFMLWESNSNMLSNNIVYGSGTDYGIGLTYADHNTVNGNSFLNNDIGINLGASSNYNKFSDNTIKSSGYYGILAGASNNTIYHNNFINNARQVWTDSINTWDDGYPSGGNYWSDYTGVDVKSGPGQDLHGSDSIGDVPYIIDADNVDHYPLMNAYGAPPLQTYSLAIISTVGGITDPAPGTYSYTANSPVQVTAIPETNYLFEYWELDDVNVGSANPYTVTMDKNRTLKAVFSPIPPPLSAFISPLSASILVGKSVTFTSTVSGGYTPYSYQWYLNGNPVSGATSASWTFTPTTSGIYYVHLKVTDDKGNTAQSDTARITFPPPPPVGGYSFPIQLQTKAEPIIPYIALIATLTAIFTKLRPKTKRKR